MIQSCEIFVRAILYRLRQSSSEADVYLTLLSLLHTLCDYRHGTDRPICSYLVTLHDWLPKVALIDGKTLQRMTLLSPVFYISCFAEDDIELLVAQLEKLAEQETENDDEEVKVSPFSSSSFFINTFLLTIEHFEYG